MRNLAPGPVPPRTHHHDRGQGQGGPSIHRKVHNAGAQGHAALASPGVVPAGTAVQGRGASSGRRRRQKRRCDDRNVIAKLFREIARPLRRPSGRLPRIIKRHERRLGDGGKTAFLELLKAGETKPTKKAAPARAPIPRIETPPPEPEPTPTPAPAATETPATSETPATPPAGEAPPTPPTA